MHAKAFGSEDPEQYEDDGFNQALDGEFIPKRDDNGNVILIKSWNVRNCSQNNRVRG